MTRPADGLPKNYPVTDAGWEQKLSWLDATTPPYGRIREAAPWLTDGAQVDWYLDGLRAALTDSERSARVARLLRLDRLAVSQ